MTSASAPVSGPAHGPVSKVFKFEISTFKFKVAWTACATPTVPVTGRLSLMLGGTESERRPESDPHSAHLNLTRKLRPASHWQALRSAVTVARSLGPDVTSHDDI